MTEIIFKLRCKNEAYVISVIRNALDSFQIKEKIKLIIIKRDKRIGNDINVDYSKLDSGKIIISFGNGKRITKVSIFHELGHAWDAIKNGLDFSHDKFSKKQHMIGGMIVNLSLDGRLEKMGLPHFSKTERFKLFRQVNKKFNLGLAKSDFSKLWGADLKKKDVMKILNKYK